MKLLFFSDIHGVPERVERLLEQATLLQPDRMILLGDVLYHGPRNGIPEQYDPVGVATLLNAHKERLLAVRGNCDSEVDQMMLNFPMLAPFSEVLTETQRFFLTHGHLWNAAQLPPVSAGTILVHGHTHIPELRVLPEKIVLFNPGSISLPKKGFPPSFGFFDGGVLTIRRLEDGETLMAYGIA